MELVLIAPLIFSSLVLVQRGPDGGPPNSGGQTFDT